MSHFHKFSQYSRLFLECSFSSGIWYHALGWLGVDGAASIDCVQHFLQHGGLFRTKKMRKVKYISFGVRSVKFGVFGLCIIRLFSRERLLVVHLYFCFVDY